MADIENSSSADAVAGGFPRKPNREQGYKKIALLLLLMEKNRAAHVLSRLPEDEVEGIVGEIVALKNIDRSQAKKIAAEFGLPEAVEKSMKAAGNVHAGPAAAEELLAAAFGEERAREFLVQAAPRADRRYFTFLDNVDFKRLEALLRDEPAQVIALAIAQADEATALRLIETLPGEIRAEVKDRMGGIDQVLPEVIRRVDDALRKKLFQQSDISTVSFDGRSTLREILSRMEKGRKRVLLDRLSEEKPDLASQLEKELFSMEIFRKIEKRDLRAFVRTIEDRDLALSLNGEKAEVKGLFFKAMPEKRKASIEAGVEKSGEEPASAVEEAKRSVLSALKARIAGGEIRLLDDDDYLIE